MPNRPPLASLLRLGTGGCSNAASTKLLESKPPNCCHAWDRTREGIQPTMVALEQQYFPSPMYLSATGFQPITFPMP